MPIHARAHLPPAPKAGACWRRGMQASAAAWCVCHLPQVVARDVQPLQVGNECQDRGKLALQRHIPTHSIQSQTDSDCKLCHQNCYAAATQHSSHGGGATHNAHSLPNQLPWPPTVRLLYDRSSSLSGSSAASMPPLPPLGTSASWGGSEPKRLRPARITLAVLWLARLSGQGPARQLTGRGAERLDMRNEKAGVLQVVLKAVLRRQPCAACIHRNQAGHLPVRLLLVMSRYTRASLRLNRSGSVPDLHEGSVGRQARLLVWA